MRVHCPLPTSAKTKSCTWVALDVLDRQQACAGGRLCRAQVILPPTVNAWNSAWMCPSFKRCGAATPVLSRRCFRRCFWRCFRRCLGHSGDVSGDIQATFWRSCRASQPLHVADGVHRMVTRCL